MSTFSELRKRHLLQIALVYLGAGWLFVEITNFLVGTYGLSTKILDTVVLLAILGFPAFLIIGWFHGERGHQRVQPTEAWLLLTLAVLGGIGTYRIVTAEETSPAATSAAAEPTSPGAELASNLSEPDLGRRSVAVLPFTNHVADEDLDWLGSGLADLLTTNFAQIPDLRVVGRQTLYDLLTERGRAESEEIPESLATTVARAAGARTMIRGTVAGSAGDLVIDAQLIELEDGTVLAGERVRGDDVFALVDTLTGRLAERLGGPSEPEHGLRIAHLGTKDMEALAAFQEGIELERAGREGEAAEMFVKAVELDSGFALPLVRLAGRVPPPPGERDVAPSGDRTGARADATGAPAAEEAARVAAWHRERAIRLLRRIGEEFDWGMDQERFLARLDSTIGEALSRVDVELLPVPDTLPG